MKVIRAKTAGFCMGVSLALHRLDQEIARATLAETDQGNAARPDGREPLVTFGPIIHNPQVMRNYASLGVGTVEDPEALQPGDRVVIRAHGIPLQTRRLLEAKEVRLVDATCPKVKKAQLAIAGQAENGAFLLLFGEPCHPEVRGLLSYAAAGSVVFGSLEELAALPLDPGKKYFLAAQTTQDRSEYEKMVDLLTDRLGNRFVALDTICDATRKRQEEALDCAVKTDLVVVVGGRNSGNTRRLAEVVRSRGTPAVHVERAADLDPDQLRQYRVIGLTAGASTPEEQIDEVQAFIEAL